jgi:hypothetical protein
MCLARAGQHERAAIEAEKLAGRGGAVQLSWAGCILGRLCSAAAQQQKLAERSADRTVELLNRAREAGWFKNAAAIDQMRSNGDRRALRSHAGDKKLLLELEQK